MHTLWGSGLLLEVDLVEGEHLVGFLGRDFHPAYLSGNASIRPSDQPLEAGLTLVGAFNVVVPTKVASHLLHLDLGAEDVVRNMLVHCQIAMDLYQSGSEQQIIFIRQPFDES